MEFKPTVLTNGAGNINRCAGYKPYLSQGSPDKTCIYFTVCALCLSLNSFNWAWFFCLLVHLHTTSEHIEVQINYFHVLAFNTKCGVNLWWPDEVNGVSLLSKVSTSIKASALTVLSQVLLSVMVTETLNSAHRPTGLHTQSNRPSVQCSIKVMRLRARCKKTAPSPPQGRDT